MDFQRRIPFDSQRIAEFCRKWRITEFSFFGSVLREDFRSDSDVDVLVSFDPGARWGLFDFSTMEEELRGIFGREADLIERASVERSENYIRRREVLNTAQPVYVE